MNGDRTPMEMPYWERIFPPARAPRMGPTAGPHANSVSRSRVPGGWLVMAGSSMAAASTVFNPDPGHQWAAAAVGGSWPHWEEIRLPRGLPGIGAVLRHVRMYRTSVPGDWLIVTVGAYPSVTFYPDPEHRWSEDAATELEAADPPAGTGTELVRE